MHMTSGLKDYGEELVKMWLLTTYDEDSGLLNLHKVRSIPLLKELISYSPDGNFDRVIAMIMIMYHIEEVKKQRVLEDNSVKTVHNDTFWERSLYVNRKKLKF